MKKGWEIKKLVDVCFVERGSSPRPIKDYITDSDNGVNWIKIGDTKEVNKYIYSTKQKITKKGAEKSRYVKEGDFILSNSMSFGKPYIMKTDGYIHDGWFVLRLYDFIDAEYFFQLLSSPYVNNQFHNLASGSVVKNISGDLVKKVVLPIPPLTEQKRIVSILDKAFAEIAQAKANAEQNLKNAKELFESYLNGIFEKKGDDWEEKTLGEVCVKTETVNPKLEPKKEFVYIDVSSVNKETKIIEETTTLLGKEAPSRARKFVRTNDVIFATVRPTHQRVAIINNEFNNQVCSTGYYVLRTKEIVHYKIIYYYILTFSFNEEMKKRQKGASYPAVTNKDVESQIISFPKPKAEQKQIVKKLDQLQAETKKLELVYQQKLDNLEELKKSILQKAFNGEL